MHYALIINAAVSLIMGLALVMVWRRDRAQAFTRYMGWANLVQLLVPASYWLSAQSSPAVALLGVSTLPVVAATYTTLLAVGTMHLAHRPVPKKFVGMFLLALVAVNAATLVLGGMRVGQGTVASINTLLGMVCTYWLWSTGTPRISSEKLVGPLLILLGLNQFTYVVYLDAGAALQATLGALLRMALGLVLLYAALERGALAARKLQHRFERITERSHQGILIHHAGRIVYANPACMGLYGATNLANLNTGVIPQSIPQAERAAVGQLLLHVESGQQDDVAYDAMRHRADGTPMWLHFHLSRTEWDGDPAVQVLISDDTERHQATQALVHQALHDDLTGLPNRAALLKSLREHCKTGATPDRLVLVLMNIDRFKLFNEAHGHSMGDDVLKAFGQALRGTMDTSVEVMRLAGDEFALIATPNGNGEITASLVTTVRQLLARPLQVRGGEIFLDASLGIALYPNSARDADSLLRAANAAMHMAKRTPGTSHRLAEKAFERGASNALEQEQALRAGIQRAEFHLVFQPKVNATTGQMTSFEALARWDRPGVGPVSPVEFIPAAERTGLIGALGTALLKQACQQIASWQQQYDTIVPVAVNVSPLQLLDPRFPQLVAHILDSCGVDAQWLTLEITESSAVQNLEQTVLQVEQLRAMGVQVAMDDFGTGFSSLNMLRTLRLHTIKIDRGLIEPLPSADAVAVVRAICQLADALHLHVVAEGVETTEQADTARDAGCGELQGYLYSRPLLPQDAGPWLE